MVSGLGCMEQTQDNSRIHDAAMRHPLPSRNSRLFQIFYLVDNEDQSVEVVETGEIDFEEVFQHLRLGGSVFITPKNSQECHCLP